jgi:ribosomal-protein-alanine N-acetyltransferase
MREPAVIEPMTLADAADVLAIEDAAFDGQARSGRLDDAKVREELERPWARLWVARRDQRIHAFIVSWHVADELHVLDVATLPSSRRTGLGRQLMEHAIDYARTHEVKHLLLEVRRSNVAAIRLYRACGFFAMGVRPRYYPDDEDAVEMALVLDPQSGAVLRKPDEVRIVTG